MFSVSLFGARFLHWSLDFSSSPAQLNPLCLLPEDVYEGGVRRDVFASFLALYTRPCPKGVLMHEKGHVGMGQLVRTALLHFKSGLSSQATWKEEVIALFRKQE